MLWWYKLEVECYVTLESSHTCDFQRTVSTVQLSVYLSHMKLNYHASFILYVPEIVTAVKKILFYEAFFTKGSISLGCGSSWLVEDPKLWENKRISNNFQLESHWIDTCDTLAYVALTPVKMLEVCIHVAFHRLSNPFTMLSHISHTVWFLEIRLRRDTGNDYF